MLESKEIPTEIQRHVDEFWKDIMRYHFLEDMQRLVNDPATLKLFKECQTDPDADGINTFLDESGLEQDLATCVYNYLCR